MINIEEQLNKLPKAKLSRQADFILRLRLHYFLWQKSFAGLKFYRLKLAPVAVGMFVFVLALMAIPAYAYWSPSVTSGHFLFPVKTTIEQVELKLSFSSMAKYQTLEKITGKRLVELEKLSVEPNQASEDAIISTVKAAIVYNQKADNELSKIKNVEDLQAAEKIEDKLKANYKNHLEQSASNIGVNADEKILDNISLALDNFSDRSDDQPIEVIKSERASTTDKHGFIINNDKNSTSSEDELVIKGNGKKQNESRPSFSTVRQQLSATEENINLLREDLPREKYQAEDVKILVDKLTNKIKKAQEALKSGDLEKSDELIKTTKAITKNAKYFVRKNKDTSDTSKARATTTSDGAYDIPTSTDQVGDEDKATTSQKKIIENIIEKKDDKKNYDQDRRNGQDND